MAKGTPTLTPSFLGSLPEDAGEGSLMRVKVGPGLVFGGWSESSGSDLIKVVIFLLSLSLSHFSCIFIKI